MRFSTSSADLENPEEMKSPSKSAQQKRKDAKGPIPSSSKGVGKKRKGVSQEAGGESCGNEKEKRGGRKRKTTTTREDSMKKRTEDNKERMPAMTYIDRIYACHEIFEKKGFNKKDRTLREMCAQKCQLDGYIPQDRASLVKHDNLFQLAFRVDPVWSLQDKIFKMYLKCELRGQEKQGELVPDMRVTDWKFVQGLNDQAEVVRLLTEVVDGRLSLKEMGMEAERMKALAKIERLFANLAHCKDFEEARKLYPDATQCQTLELFIPILKDYLKGPKRPGKGKELSKDDDVENNVEIPFSFKNFVKSACELRAGGVALNEREAKEFKFTNTRGQSYYWGVFQSDVRVLSEVLPKKEYTLAIIDMPYGYNAQGAENDSIRMTEEDFRLVVGTFKISTTSLMWRFVVFHSYEQSHMVQKVLRKSCNAGVEWGLWHKTNLRTLTQCSGLVFAADMWSIGYFHMSGVRSKDLYNFTPNEVQENVIASPAVSNKCTYLDEMVVNPYQKPVEVMSWFVKHFSRPGDWVLDLCAGTGSTTVAALQHGRSCFAMELSKKQCHFILSRIQNMHSNLSLEYRESGSGPRSLEPAPPQGPGKSATMLHVLAVDPS